MTLILNVQILNLGDPPVRQSKVQSPDDLIHIPEGEISIIGIESGMQSGNPSIALFVELPDKKELFLEMSYKSLMEAARILHERFGDVN